MNILRSAGGIACVSAAALMLEVVLSRLFSIAHGQELSYMVISLALFGYGLASPLLCRSDVMRRQNSSFWAIWFSVAIVLVLYAAHFIVLDAGRLAWEIGTWFQTALLYLLWTIPFLFSGLTIASLFMRQVSRAHGIYAGDLLGAGVGAMVPFLILPHVSLYLAAVLAATGAFILARQKRERVVSAVLCLLFMGLVFVQPDWFPKMSPSRGLHQALLDPQAKVIQTKWTSRMRLDLFSGAAARVAPGLSLNYLGQMPRPMGLALDGHEIVPILKGDVHQHEYLSYLPQALPYVFLSTPTVALIQTHGGVSLAAALFHGAAVIDVIESEPALSTFYPDYAALNWVYDSARSFLKRQVKQYDLIVMRGLGASGALSSGFELQNPNYHLTEEMIAIAFQSLKRGGLLEFNLYRLPPPRAELRLFATIQKSLNTLNVDEPEKHLRVIGTLQTYSFLVKKTPFSKEDDAKLNMHLEKQGYDLVTLALPRDYDFITTSVTDDRPFPGQSIRWTKIKSIVEKAQGRWQLVIEGGGLSWAVFLIALITSIIILLIAWSRDLKETHQKFKLMDPIFVLIGLGFIFLEIGWIQRSVVMLKHASEAVPLILASVLIGAGVGSFMAGKIRISKMGLVKIACLGASLLALLSAYVLPCLLDLFVGLQASYLLLVLSIGVGAIVLGMPFPTMLSVFEKNSLSVPWVWGLNACATVVGAVLASALIPYIGFKVLFLLAGVFYLLAFLFALFQPSAQNEHP